MDQVFQVHQLVEKTHKIPVRFKKKVNKNFFFNYFIQQANQPVENLYFQKTS